MAKISNKGNKRLLVFDGNSSDSTISFKDYVSLMKQYGSAKARTVRTSRKYLRSLGLNIDKKGNFVVENKS